LTINTDYVISKTMNERLRSDENAVDPLLEARMDRLVDNGVYNYDSARRQVGDDDAEITPARRAMSRANHPAGRGRKRQPRYDGDAFPVIDNSDLSEEEMMVNAHGAALARLALHQNDPPRTAQQIAEARAHEARRQRNY
jgi:hypothetical protein